MEIFLKKVNSDSVAYVPINYDNSGNVDYKSILNSDVFVELEKRRLTKLA